ncbi:MAG: hypothetical protein GX219_05720 [Tissierellia bacterium]|nr:hypothetical protein [Tissierellia bacterium]
MEKDSKEKRDKLNEVLQRAVALQYDIEVDNAPKVVAKGQGRVAENIIEKGADADVRVYKDEKLVDSLFGLQINEEIPEELYQAVAEIIFYIYNVDGKRGMLDGL